MKNQNSQPGRTQHLPNILTSVNLMMGVLSIFLMVGDFSSATRRIACIFILVGVVADALDGKVARILNAESDFGKQLDSFADSITFGLAPMVVLYSFEQLQNSFILLVALVVYTMAGVFRLARFNLGDFTDFFLGLPITAAGAMTAMYALFLSFTVDIFGAELSPFTAFILFVLSGFMVSTVRVPRVNMRYLKNKILGNR